MVAPYVSTRFVEPPWDAPLDTEMALAQIPGTATISGMFLAPLVEAARARGVQLPSAREHYIAYRFYPLLEHARLLLEAARTLHGRLPLRKALRKLGRGAPLALMGSTLGRVVLASAEKAPLPLLEALAKAYGLNLRPGEAEVVEHGDHHALLAMRHVHYFLDCHHVGALEGALKPLALRPTVRIASTAPGSSEFLVSW